MISQTAYDRDGEQWWPIGKTKHFTTKVCFYQSLDDGDHDALVSFFVYLS